MSPARVLVSGSSGLIGSALIPVLQREGYEVVRLVRRGTSSPNQIVWDFSSPGPSVSGFDAVVHLAGESIVGRWTAEKKRQIRESRVLGTRRLCEALAGAQQRPRVLVSGSAIGIYGDRGDEILREESPSGSGFLAEVCREWEAVAGAVASAGILVAQLRTGVVLSRNGGALSKMLTPFRLGVGGNMGNGRQWWSWIALEDQVGAILHILKTDSLNGPVNAVAPNPVTNAEFTETLASLLSRPAVFPMPAFAARLAFGEMADELLLASQKVEPGKLKACGYAFRQPDLHPALESILKM